MLSLPTRRRTKQLKKLEPTHLVTGSCDHTRVNHRLHIMEYGHQVLVNGGANVREMLCIIQGNINVSIISCIPQWHGN